MFIKESQIRSIVRDLLLEQEYKAGSGGYEYTKKDKKIYITKSPKSKRASRDNPILVSQEKNPKAWDAIASRHFPDLLDKDDKKSEQEDMSGSGAEEKRSSKDKDKSESNVEVTDEKDLAIKKKDGVKKKSKKVNKKSWNNIELASWVRSEEDTLDAIHYNGKRYLAYGFAEHKGRKGAAVLMPFVEFRDLMSTSKTAVSAYGPEEAIKLIKGGMISQKTKKGMRRVFIPWNTADIELEISTLSMGTEDATIGDQIAELMSIPAGLPVIGAPADLANVFIYSAIQPPKWFAAFLSLFGVVPALGEVCAVLRGVKSLKVLKNGDEAALGVLKYINSSEPLRNTLKGKSLISHLRDNRKYLFDILEDNASVMNRFGIDSAKVIQGLNKFTDEFFKAYAVYAKYTFLNSRKEISRWLALTQRSLATIVGDQLANSEKVYDEVEATGVFTEFGVAPTGDLEADMETLAKKMEGRAGDYSDEMIASLEKLEKDVIVKSGVAVT